MSQTNIRERQPVQGHSGTSAPASGSDPSPRPPEHDDLVWPPEPDSLNAIEVVPLERVSITQTAPQGQPGRAPAPAAAPVAEPAREPAPETNRFDDLQDLDLDTLFAPSAAARPAVQKTPPADRRSADRDRPDDVPSAVLAQPEEVGPDLLLVPPRGEGSGTPPIIHIKWDERLDDDVPAVPLSGIARGRELAEARRAAAAATGAGAGNESPAASSAPSGPAVHPLAKATPDREMPDGLPDVSLDRGFAASPERTTTLRRVKVSAAAVLLLAVAVGGVWWRDVLWDALQPGVAELQRNAWTGSATPQAEPSTPAPPAGSAPVNSTAATRTTATGATSRVTPPASEPAPNVTDRQVTEGGATAAASSSREVLPQATDARGTSPRIPVPPPVRVEVPASTRRDATPTPAAVERATEVPIRPAAFTGPAQIASRDLAPGPPANVPTEVQPEVARDLPAETPARLPLPPAAETGSNRSAAPAAAPAAVTPAPAPPTVAAPGATNETSPARNVEADVRDALASYRSAYANLDAAAAQRIWPTVDERALARAFSSLKSQQIRFDRCDVQVGDGAATARCEGAATFVPRVGRQEPQTEQRRWSFVLRPSSDGWRIERAETSR